MLQTPASFSPLLVAQQHAAPINLVFCGDMLMVRESDLDFPDQDTLAGLGLDPMRFQPIGLFGGRYCQTTWLEPGSPPAPGFVFRKLRSLFGENNVKFELDPEAEVY